MEYQPRPASASDRGFLFALHKATMYETIEKTWGWDEAWQRGNFDRRFNEQTVSIIEVEGRAAGGLWLETRPDVLYVADFQVLPELQGRGIGTAVLRTLIAEAVERGVPIGLAVLPANPRAQRLYERLGFRVVGREDPFIYMRYEPRPSNPNGETAEPRTEP